jgi:hypothetical protein
MVVITAVRVTRDKCLVMETGRGTAIHVEDQEALVDREVKAMRLIWVSPRNASCHAMPCHGRPWPSSNTLAGPILSFPFDRNSIGLGGESFQITVPCLRSPTVYSSDLPRIAAFDGMPMTFTRSRAINSCRSGRQHRSTAPWRSISVSSPINISQFKPSLLYGIPLHIRLQVCLL